MYYPHTNVFFLPLSTWCLPLLSLSLSLPPSFSLCAPFRSLSPPRPVLSLLLLLACARPSFLLSLLRYSLSNARGHTHTHTHTLNSFLRTHVHIRTLRRAPSKLASELAALTFYFKDGSLSFAILCGTSIRLIYRRYTYNEYPRDSAAIYICMYRGCTLRGRRSPRDRPCDFLRRLATKSFLVIPASVLLLFST